MIPPNQKDFEVIILKHASSKILILYMNTVNFGILTTADVEFNQIIHLSLSTFILCYVSPYRRACGQMKICPNRPKKIKIKRATSIRLWEKVGYTGWVRALSYMNVAPDAATYYNSPLYNKLFNYLKRKRTFYIEKNA